MKPHLYVLEHIDHRKWQSQDHLEGNNVPSWLVKIKYDVFPVWENGLYNSSAFCYIFDTITERTSTLRTIFWRQPMDLKMFKDRMPRLHEQIKKKLKKKLRIFRCFYYHKYSAIGISILCFCMKYSGSHFSEFLRKQLGIKEMLYVVIWFCNKYCVLIYLKNFI